MSQVLLQHSKLKRVGGITPLHQEKHTEPVIGCYRLFNDVKLEASQHFLTLV